MKNVRVIPLIALAMTASQLLTSGAATGVPRSGAVDGGGGGRSSSTIDSPRQAYGPHGPGTIAITPHSRTRVTNCIPFANNTRFGFTGFIYRNIRPFILRPHDKLAFDLGGLNHQITRRNIYMAVANKNPLPATVDEQQDVQSQGVRATDWVQVVSESQVPENPHGNRIRGDYELRYESERVFRFTGGGLIIGFASSPPPASEISDASKYSLRPIARTQADTSTLGSA
jgi:hypothetical protein